MNNREASQVLDTVLEVLLPGGRTVPHRFTMIDGSVHVGMLNVVNQREGLPLWLTIVSEGGVRRCLAVAHVVTTEAVPR